jgi:hypothetical protein
LRPSGHEAQHVGVQLEDEHEHPGGQGGEPAAPGLGPLVDIQPVEEIIGQQARIGVPPRGHVHRSDRVSILEDRGPDEPAGRALRVHGSVVAV